jgi:hypothetical protein
VDLLATEPGRDPHCHLRARPQAAVIRWITQPIRQRHHYFGRQDCRRSSIAASLIAQCLRPDCVVARNQKFDPARHEPQNVRHLGEAAPFGKKPYRLEMASGDGLRSGPVPLLKFFDAQMLCQRDNHAQPPLPNHGGRF